MKFNCPECHRAVEVEGRFIGKLAACPYCGEEVRVPMVSGDPPPAEVRVEEQEDERVVGWTNLPWRESASVANALRVLLLVLGAVIALLLFRIERQLASIPRMAEVYEEKGEAMPQGVTEAERRAPVVHMESAIGIERGSEVKVGNLADDPIPVRVRD